MTDTAIADTPLETTGSEHHGSFSVSSDRSAASASSTGVAAEQVARTAAAAADAKKADDVAVLDLTSLSDAVVDEVEEKVADACGEHPFSIEGRDEGSWILMDYGSVIVHVFSPEARDYYRLERLWGDAPVLDLGF